MAAGEQLDDLDAAERMVSLAMAIAAAPYGISRRDLYKAIREYRSMVATKASPEALSKKFERDIEALRDLGVSISVPGQKGDIDAKYVMDKGVFEWPEGFHLSARQIALLQMAGDVWRQAAFSSDAATALDRARAFGDVSDDPGIIGWSPRLQTSDLGFYPITRAIEKHTEIQFDYRKPGTKGIVTRTLQPWKLSFIAGNWMVTGFDETAEDNGKKGAIRNFLLKRMIGDVKRLTTQFAAPSAADIASAIEKLDAHTRSQLAEIEVRPQSAAASHFGLAGKSDLKYISHEFNYTDVYVLADELREFALDIQVNGPAELVKAYQDGFAKIASDHA
ncbi:MAG: helix-turn-helix transcriptional regulator [Micrococcales bacterium]